MPAREPSESSIGLRACDYDSRRPAGAPAARDEIGRPGVLGHVERILAGGSYAASAATVDVALELANAARAVGGTPIELGQQVEGSLIAGTADRYTLSATAGQIVYLDALGDCVDDLRWQLLRPDGGLAASQTTCADIGRQVLGVAGEWTIEIYSDGQASGGYSFSVIGVP